MIEVPKFYSLAFRQTIKKGNSVRFEGNTLGFVRDDEHLNETLFELFSGASEIVISVANLPSHGPARILEGLLLNNKLIKAEYPEKFFDEAQIAKLSTHIENNKVRINAKEQKQESNSIDNQKPPTVDQSSFDAGNQTSKSKRRWTMIGATLAVAAAILTGQPWSLAFVYGAITGLISYQLKKMHIAWAQKHYTSPQSIEAASPREKSALKCGIEATTWKGYFTSFTHWQTYRHPQAFASAMQHAQEKNEDIVNTIRGVKVV